MKTTIDAAGRLVIPKKIRDAAGLTPGMELQIHVCDGLIEIEPARVPMRFVERDGLLVAEPLVPVEPLTIEAVEDLRRKLREERVSPMNEP